MTCRAVKHATKKKVTMERIKSGKAKLSESQSFGPRVLSRSRDEKSLV